MRMRSPTRRSLMKTWMRVADAAEYADVSRDTIYTACERNEMRHVRIGGRRSIRLKAEWIDAWLEHHVRGAERQGQRSGGSMGATV
jgi:excisionase family DNA binding protein